MYVENIVPASRERACVFICWILLFRSLFASVCHHLFILLLVSDQRYHEYANLLLDFFFIHVDFDMDFFFVSFHLIRSSVEDCHIT